MKYSVLRAALTLVLGLSFAFVACGDDGETAIWLRIVSPDIEIDQINLSFFDSTDSGQPLATEEIPLGLSKEYTAGATNPENQLWILIYAGEDAEQRLTIEAMGLRDGREVGNGQAAGLQFEPGKIIEASHVLTLSHAGEDKDGDGFYTPPLSVYPLEDEELSLYDCDDGNEDINPEAPELCDTIDNDCDKSIDEGCGCDVADSPRECYPQWADEPMGGACTAGTQECLAGTWADCVGVVIPAPERCADADTDFQCSVCGDGIDNDCDGFVDIRDPGRNPNVPNDPANALDLGCGGCFVGTYNACYTGPPGTQNQGLCQDGQAECLDGTYGECIGEVLPTLGEDELPSEGDLCDGFDNDCDGTRDDMDISPSCTLTRGVCFGTHQKCDYYLDPEHPWVDCSVKEYNDNALLIICGGETPPACCSDNPPTCPGYTLEENDPLFCDGYNNDCDDDLDEVLNPDGTQACHCVNGETLLCPWDESVMGIDPNEGECNAGVYMCDNGVWVTSPSCIEPENVETCDALDNTCDGNTDGTEARLGCPASQEHAYWQTCDMGQCIFICQEDYWDIDGDLGLQDDGGCEYHCTLTDPIQELCDGEDNDCDQLTDAAELTGVTDPAQRRSIIDNLCPPRVDATLDPNGICTSPYYCTYICNDERGDCINPDLTHPLNESSDGCETDLRGNPSHCGACGNTCDPNEVCNGLSCRCGSSGPDCDGTNSDYCCGTTCTNLLSDESNCGGCGTICQEVNGTSTCVSGICTPSCNASWGDCDGNPNNGCETSLWEDDSCGSSCTSRPNCNNRIQNATGAYCNEGSCDYLQCHNDHDNCDGTRANGCETYLWDTSSCGTTCNTRTNCNIDIRHANIATCNEGSCAFAGCHNGYANCDNDPTNGCEKDIWETDSCSTNCFGAVNCMVDVEHASNPSCPNGSCAFGSCHSGWEDCDFNISNGCERATWAVDNCGSGCGTLPNCNTTVVHASGIECASGTCEYTSCIGNNADCRGGESDGCETPLGTDINCSSCGDNCQADSTCTNNVCTCDHLACASDCCAWGEVCHNNSCCMPNCTGRECGSDSCGSSCGNCTLTGETCNVSGICVCDSSHENCDNNDANGCECDISGTNVCHNNACCTPNCAGKECGSDGCGGSCGTCTLTGETCNSSGLCVCDFNHEDCDGVSANGCECDVSGTNICYNNACCTPNCSGRECGTDGCGGSCGSCGANEECTAGTCECEASHADCDNNGSCECDVSGPNICHNNTCCTPNCSGRECGTDGCGGSCGNCESGETCNGSGICVCDATHADCDSDGSCECDTSGTNVCHNNACCTPATCGANNCNTINDGCGGTMECGGCDAGETCNAGTCECDANHADCDSNGSCECDTSGTNVCHDSACCTPVDPCGAGICEWASDGCGNLVDCGGCGAGETCNAGTCECDATHEDCDSNGSCECDTSGTSFCHLSSCCTPDCSGKDCGDDGCGGTCGSCVPVNEVCNVSGQCVCAPNMANCDGEEANGCEINTSTSADHCSGCGLACETGFGCASSACACSNNPDCNAWQSDWVCTDDVCTPP
ncbi:MAG: hypothetical protein KAI66_10060 [Lentisphaeria bacterium]|nr:hypothetical protein [Lentisphaeria bacterium]